MTAKGFRLTNDDMLPLEVRASTLDGITVQLPDGFYTTFSTLAGGSRVLGLQAHLDRLYVPARDAGLRPSVDEQTLRRRIVELAREYLPRESRVRLMLTKNDGNVYLGIQPFIPLDESVYENGVHVITADLARHDPRIKGTDFITASAEQRKRVKDDIFEILLTKNGRILEGMTSNFYAVKHVVASREAAKQSFMRGGLLRAEDRRPRNDIKLITARNGILLGVTRKAVLRLARGQGMSIEYRAPHMDEGFKEAFLTSSSRGVVPIVMIDGKPVGEGRVGAWAKTLRKAYQAYVEERSEALR
jgi:branched-subunit amino acid aminotransferase/4-amino-4-deoxychorismate lyase